MSIGKLKVILDRQRNYISYINFFMVGYLFIDKAGWHWWYLLIIPVIVIVAYFDSKYILRQEMDYLHRKSPVLTEILKDVQK